MAESGAKPKVPPLRARALRAVSAFTSPLLPDDYLELINPLWSTRELRGRIEELERGGRTRPPSLIRPGYDWVGHEPGQYLRIGFDIDGVRHWRAYSLTSDPDRPDGCISITPKLVEEGKVSPYVSRRARPGRDRPPGRGRGRVRAPGPAAGEAPVHQRRQRDHADHEHAAPASIARTSSTTSSTCTRRRTPTTSSSATDCATWPSATTASGCTSSTPARTRAASRPPTSTSSAPTGASARPSSPARRRCSTRSTEHWEDEGDCDRCTWSASSRSSAATGPGGRGRHDQVPARATSRPSPTAASRSSSPARRPGSSCRSAAAMGICHTCVGKLCSGQAARPAHRRGPRRGGRDRPHLHQRPRGPGRDRTLNRHRSEDTEHRR